MSKQNLLKTALFLPSAFIIFLLLLFGVAARNEVFADVDGCTADNVGEYCEHRGDNYCCGVGYCNVVYAGVCKRHPFFGDYYCDPTETIDPSRGHDPCVWACGCRPATPTPTPTLPPGTPTPTPTPTPVQKWASLSYDCTNYPAQSPALLASWDVGTGANCNAYIQAGETPHQISTDCASGETRTIRDASYIWNGGIYQLRVGDPSGTTTPSSSVTIDCGGPPPPPPPPPGEYPPPYFQIFWEVANITKGESILDDCGKGSSPSCSGDWGGFRYWPPSCSNRLIKQTTTASLNDEIQARACFRRMGSDSRYNRAGSLKFWLNLAEPGYVPLGNAGENWWVRNAFGGWQSIGPSSGNYQYNNATSRVPYAWLGTTGDLDGYIQNCGSPGGGDDYWEYGCVREVRYKFNIKNDPSLENKAVSAKGWFSISPAVNPYSFHMYLTSCIAGNDLNSLGFWNRTPGCCWGQPFYRNDIDGWPGCPIPEGDPRYNNCRYGPCDQGANPVNENFVFWSNWIKINVGSPNTISGNVYDDPGGSCATTPVNGGVWNNARMKLTDLGLEDLLGDGFFQFSPVTGRGHGLWMYKNAGSQGLPSGWTCSNCASPGNTCSGANPGTPDATAGQIYNFFVKQGANAWFQAQGGDIHGQGSISSPIPTTAPNRNFSQDLDGYPGVVSYTGSLFLKDGQVSSKGWSANSAFVPGQSTYNYFYQKLGSPTEDNFNGDLSAIIADGTYYSADNVTINNDWSFPGSRKAIVLINGKLEINKKINVPQGSFLAFIVKQNIEIKGTVGDKNPIATPHLEGIFLTDGLMKTNYDGDNSGMRLVGSGIFIAHGGFVLGRDLKDTPPVPNSTTPAEFFLFRPDLVLNSPKELWGSSMSWVEVAP